MYDNLKTQTLSAYQGTKLFMQSFISTGKWHPTPTGNFTIWIEKARNLGIPDEDIIVVDPNDFRDKANKVDQESFGGGILNATRRHDVTVVTQNGWMPLTPVIVIDEYPDAMFNQHPGPVPEFGG